MDGLTTAIATRKLKEHGPNELPSKDRRTGLQMILGIIREPMLVLLVAATAIYVAFGDLAEAGALGCSVLAIVVIAVLQERRTERALDALRELASPHARVLRDGAWTELDARSLVPADIIQLSEGDRVPADALLRSGSPLAVDESLLTGESVPVMRLPDLAATTLGRPGDAGGAVFAGTLVGSGHAVAEVVGTGQHTEVGRIGTALGEIELARAPLHREIGHVVRRVAAVALLMCLALAVIYIASGRGWLDALLAGITLAMSLLPEELPLVLTVFLTLGAWRIARHRVLARRAAAIETLGAVTVLCVDKTGTLTQNRMAIARIESTALVHDVRGDAATLPEEIHEAVEFGLLASPRNSVDPMDRAFARLAERTLANTEHVHPDWRWVREYPLSPGLLAVTHVWRDDHARTVVATKGAPEAIIDLCHLDEDEARRWRERVEAMARNGLRVLGVARASLTGGAMPSNPHDYAFELVGMVGLADPLRDDTAATIATCHSAGVRVIMITGDHPTTAIAIARAAGLPTHTVLTGQDIEQLGERELADALADVAVIARAAPAHKLRIIQALRMRGDIVGMTGDGVNDAPALTAADVGIAMGHGTDVAREAAGLVLLDDALAPLVAAIRTGRTIYDNLRKVASYLLAVHVPIAGLALLPPILGWPILLGPVHIVLLELVIDPTCSIVFEQEPSEPAVMNRPPRSHEDRLFHARRVGNAVLLGLAALAGPIAVAAFAAETGLAPTSTRVLAFAALIAAGLALVMATRGRARTDHNHAVKWMFAGVAFVVALTVAIPWLRGLFGFAVPEPRALLVALLAGSLPVLLVGAISARGNKPAAGPRPTRWRALSS